MEKSTFIPILKIVFRVILGVLLLIAGYLKVQDNTALFESIAYITWIPLFLKSAIIDTLPWIEILVGGLLVFNLLGRVVKPAALMIYFSFFIFAIYGLGAGIEGDCGCFGDPESGSILATLLGSEFGWKMVIRNGLFLTMAAALFIPADKRTD
ncbi:MauE/DoxX family redox-associated membrane protein [Rhodohalobacter halophilus]|uniref:MauE/DoxX family redox-associated membrane protein n=1 Tax=Rhodohalobacter halophilus TaxID=1812810 RepID=UPI00159EFF9B|nr:MauE/DoxX family redox-associated membrane protein [Rhodohalobacter halophilus]